MRPPTRGLAERPCASFTAGVGVVVGGTGFGFAAAEPKPPNDGVAAGAGVDFCVSDGLTGWFCDNPVNVVDPAGEAVVDLLPKVGVPNANLDESCWRENGLLELGAGAGLSCEVLLRASSVLLNGEAVRGELLRGALELNPRNDPLLAGTDAGGVFAAGGVELFAGALAIGAFDDGTKPEAGLVDGMDLFRDAKENDGVSLL